MTKSEPPLTFLLTHVCLSPNANAGDRNEEFSKRVFSEKKEIICPCFDSAEFHMVA